jgi:hypothetical protein
VFSEDATLLERTLSAFSFFCPGRVGTCDRSKVPPSRVASRFVGVTGKGGREVPPLVTAGDQASSYPVLSVIVTAESRKRSLRSLR